MVNHRRVTTFQQLIDDALLEIGDGYRAQNSELGGTGPIFLRAGHLSDTHIDFAGVEHFHDHLAEKVRSKMSRVGDTVVTTKGNSTGRTSFVTERLPPFVYSPHLSYWRSLDPERLCGGFLRYWSRGSEFIRQLSGMKASTDMAPYLSLTDQKRLKITLPPPCEQKIIAKMLGALDDKIELNRRMNETLEAVARALFQSWFVDFDPVRAKLDGRPPAGLDRDTAALFPTAFHNSVVGAIPDGWDAGRLDDVLSLQRGFDLPASERTHGKYSVVAASGPNGWHDKFMVKGPGVTTGRSGALGRVFFIHEDFWPLNTSLWVKEFKRVSPAYAFHLLQGLDFGAFNSGSAVPTLNRNHVHNLQVVIPPRTIVKAFDSQVLPLMKKQKSNEDESATLAALRDTLLPKLLSGELSVASAERELEVSV